MSSFDEINWTLVLNYFKLQYFLFLTKSRCLLSASATQRSLYSVKVRDPSQHLAVKKLSCPTFNLGEKAETGVIHCVRYNTMKTTRNHCLFSICVSDGEIHKSSLSGGGIVLVHHCRYDVVIVSSPLQDDKKVYTYRKHYK